MIYVVKDSPKEVNHFLFELRFMHGDADLYTTVELRVDLPNETGDESIHGSIDILDRYVSVFQKLVGTRAEKSELFADNDALFVFYCMEREDVEYDESWYDCEWPIDKTHCHSPAKLDSWKLFFIEAGVRREVEVKELV